METIRLSEKASYTLHSLFSHDTIEEKMNYLIVLFIEQKTKILEDEDQYFRHKWKMDFQQFEIQKDTLSEDTWQLDKDYFEWDRVITELEEYTKLRNLWNEQNSLQN
jgi:hypothetical protein